MNECTVINTLATIKSKCCAWKVLQRNKKTDVSDEENKVFDKLCGVIGLLLLP